MKKHLLPPLFICYISNRYQPYTTIQSRWQWLPISIRYRFVLQIHHIDFIEDTPFLTPTIHIRNAVGRQIGHFYFYLVISRFQPFAYFQLIRYGPCRSGILSVDAHTGTFPHITQIQYPVIGGNMGNSDDIGIYPVAMVIGALG